jgi:hypothetical protein
MDDITKESRQTLALVKQRMLENSLDLRVDLEAAS